MKQSTLISTDTLTPFEVGLIRTSFRVVQEQSAPAAQRFFRELFSYDRLLRDLFAPSPWTRQADLMGVLNGVIGQLDHSSALTAHLDEVVRRFPVFAINSYYHLYVGAALFATLEDTLGSRFSAAVYAAWFKLFQRTVVAVKSAIQANLHGRETARPFAHPTAA